MIRTPQRDQFTAPHGLQPIMTGAIEQTAKGGARHLWQQALTEGVSDDLPATDAEGPLRRRIDLDDTPLVIEGHDGIQRGLHHGRLQRLGLTHLRLVATVRLLPRLQHQSGEVGDPLLQQQQLIAVLVKAGLGDTQGALREAGHPLQDTIEPGGDDIDQPGEDQDEDHGRIQPLAVIEDPHMPGHPLNIALADEGREQEVVIRPLVLGQGLRGDLIAFAPLITRGSGGQIGRVCAGQDALIVTIHQGDRRPRRVQTALGGGQEGLIDRHQDDQIPHLITGRILHRIADQEEEGVAELDRHRLLDFGVQEPGWDTGGKRLRQCLSARQIQLPDPALKVGE